MARLGELFAGYGGLGMGVEAALGPMERVWVSEFDPAPARILVHHWPAVPNLGDVTKVDWSEVEPVDVLTGGFPCQDVSLAGRRAGLKDGTRSGLWSYMRDAIDVLRPSLVVIENVRGLLSAQAGGSDDLGQCELCVASGRGHALRALGAVLGDLANIGFDAEWALFPASGVGAAHRRERCFIIAWPADSESSAGRVSDGDYAAATDSDGDVLGQQRGGASAEEAGPGEGHGSADSGRGSGPLMPTPEANLGRHGHGQPVEKRRSGGHSVSLADAMHSLMPTPTASEHTGAGHAASKTGSPNLRTVVELMPTPKAGDADFGTPRTSGRPPEMSTHLGTRLVYRDFGEYAPAVAQWAAVIGRPAPAPTEEGPKGGTRLSARFVEWLMGLPEGHVTSPAIGLTRMQQLKALGNGVVPQQAAEAVKQLMERKEAA